MNLKEYIRDVPDFPKPGIIFKDISPLLKNPKALSYSIDKLIEPFSKNNIDIVAGVEARGFLLSTPISLKLNKPMIPIRKIGKLPYKTFDVSYDLEYGKDTIEIHKDAIRPGDKVLIVDDLLATGGTINACIKLINTAGGVVKGLSFIIELTQLNGREILLNANADKIHSIIKY